MGRGEAVDIEVDVGGGVAVAVAVETGVEVDFGLGVVVGIGLSVGSGVGWFVGCGTEVAVSSRTTVVGVDTFNPGTDVEVFTSVAVGCASLVCNSDSPEHAANRMTDTTAIRVVETVRVDNNRMHMSIHEFREARPRTVSPPELFVSLNQHESDGAYWSTGCSLIRRTRYVLVGSGRTFVFGRDTNNPPKAASKVGDRMRF